MMKYNKSTRSEERVFYLNIYICYIRYFYNICFLEKHFFTPPLLDFCLFLCYTLEKTRGVLDMLLLNGLTPPDDFQLPPDPAIVQRDTAIYFAIVGIVIAILIIIIIRNNKSDK